MIRHVLLFMLLLMTASAETLRVMSFNVRYPNPKDGADAWELRRDLLVDTIRRNDPHLIGTQELFKMQGDYIVSQLPEYKWFGTSRRGNQEDEHMGVFYKSSDLTLLEQGQFWLSETPDVPGSQSWDVTLPRMVTWGLFNTRDGQHFYFLNTHFAHRREDEAARLKSAALIAQRAAAMKNSAPLVLTGDFNAPAGGEVHRTLLAAGLRDTRKAAAKKSGPEGTFHGFRGKPREATIDWILVSPEWKVVSNQTITDSETGRYPSDHFPVLAVLELGGN